MMKRIVWVAALAMLVMIALVLSRGAPMVTANAQGSSPATAEVKIDSFAFGPGTLTVAVGTKVTWTNRDDIPHTVVSSGGAFRSKVLATGEEFSYIFAKAGTFPYFCSIHPQMTGKVVVQ
jgi:plastocyanin